MVTDLAGHVAATYLRGLPLVHVPTSLLAMVDAAVGGKVAVNHPQAKNVIGAFYQPRLVLADVSTLRTLPPRELTSGWAELIKHALILEPDLLAFLEERADAILGLEPEPSTEAIRRSVAVKAAAAGDDAAFARFWTETRQALRPRSGRLLAVELRRLGVTKETSEWATSDISDEDAAHQAASTRLRALRGLEYQRFRERLGRFLTRRGFTYDVARRTIERCWAELEEAQTGSETS